MRFFPYVLGVLIFTLSNWSLIQLSASELADETHQPRVFQVAVSDTPETYIVPGSIISDGRIDVSSRVVGFIEQLDVREGQKVAKGDLLVRIDQTDIDEAIRQAQAGVKAAQEDLQDAEFDVRKFDGLARIGSVATETFRKAKVRMDVGRTALDKARSTLSSAEAQKSYATITSPVEGVIVSVAGRGGEMATAGTRILTVESRETLLFKAFLSESHLSGISESTPVTIRVDTIGKEVFQGRIRGIVPSGDDITRRYEINIVLPKEPRFVPGMFGRAEILLGTRKAVVIPHEALVRRGGLDGVFAIENGIARFRWLRIGKDFPNGVEIVSGLSGGETIVLSAGDGMRDGSAIANSGRLQ